MARVLALVPDLLFGSRVQSALTAAGHEVELVGDERSLRERLGDRARSRDGAGTLGGKAAVLVVDLTNPDLEGAALVEALSADGALARTTRTLGFYSHVDSAARARAEQAGFDLVVPRSRMAREGPQLVERLSGA
jgi:CheY-like chemotaxis protein